MPAVKKDEGPAAAEVAGDDNGGTASTAGRQRAPRGTGTTPKVTYHVYADADVMEAVGVWVCGQDAPGGSVVAGELVTPAELEELAAAFPKVVAAGDLIYLATWAAADRDGAVGMMLADEQPTDRVRLVQLVHKAHVDLDIPTVAGSYLNDVPVHWKLEPTFSIGGKR